MKRSKVQLEHDISDMRKAADELAYKAENSADLGAKKISMISQSNAIKNQLGIKKRSVGSLLIKTSVHFVYLICKFTSHSFIMSIDYVTLLVIHLCMSTK